jgi:hypothetical protein
VKCTKGAIVLYDDQDKVVLYTFHVLGEKLNEFDKFIDRFDVTPTNVEEGELLREYQIVQKALEKTLVNGARKERFREEDSVHALPGERCGLRLYAIRFSEYTILVGNGGIKTSQKLKDSKDCAPHKELLEALSNAIIERVAAGEIWWEGDYLCGDLYFELGDCE